MHLNILNSVMIDLIFAEFNKFSVTTGMSPNLSFNSSIKLSTSK